jgi:protein-tyrosine phosphatase
MPDVRILFVCRGNTCRSPMAVGVLRRIVDDASMGSRFFIDGAGTHAGLLARPPDPRARAAARERGIDIDGLRARNVTVEDFHTFDYIYAADESVLATLKALAPSHAKAEVALLMSLAPEMGTHEVPDPWHGTAADYEHALDLLTAAAWGIAAKQGVPSA